MIFMAFILSYLESEFYMQNNATDKPNNKNPKTGITSILAEVNALVALMFGYKNLKKKD